MHEEEFEIRRATPADAEAIAVAHVDSIRSIGPAYYDAGVVDDWCARVEPGIYVRAMQGGEAFFIAIDPRHPDVVLGFSSHHGDGTDHGVGVYVRGTAARRGIGSALLQHAEREAIARGASTLEIDASLAAVDFYRMNGFEERGRGAHRLRSGRTMPCVFMRKMLRVEERGT